MVWMRFCIQTFEMHYFLCSTIRFCNQAFEMHDFLFCRMMFCHLQVKLDLWKKKWNKRENYIRSLRKRFAHSIQSQKDSPLFWKHFVNLIRFYNALEPYWFWHMFVPKNLCDCIVFIHKHWIRKTNKICKLWSNTVISLLQNQWIAMIVKELQWLWKNSFFKEIPLPYSTVMILSVYLNSKRWNFWNTRPTV